MEYNMRDDFTSKVRNTLAERVGYRCSWPDCRIPTSGPHPDPSKRISIGKAAHITAASPGGPRYDSSLTSEQRKSIENGIWMCGKHAEIIDTDEHSFTVDLLIKWKQEAENDARKELERYQKTMKNDVIPFFRGKYIRKIEDLEDLWKERYKYLRNSSSRGIIALSDFWDKICCADAWEPHPDELAQKIQDSGTWIISAYSGNGKTMFLLTLAKELLKNNSAKQKVVFLEPDAIFREEQINQLTDCILFIDLPKIDERNPAVFLRNLHIATQSGCVVIFSQYPENVQSLYENIHKNDLNVALPLFIDKSIDRWKRLEKTASHIFDGWGIQWDDASRGDKTFFIQKILEELKNKGVKQELLFLTENLGIYKSGIKKLSITDITNFLEPIEYSYKKLLNLIKDKDKFFNALNLLKRYFDWLQERFLEKKWNFFPIIISTDGVLDAIAGKFGIDNLYEIMVEARIINPHFADPENFSEFGFGGRIIEKYRGNYVVTYLPRQEDLDYIVSSLIKKKLDFEEKRIDYLEFLLDLFTLIFTDVVQEDVFNSSVNILKKFPHIEISDMVCSLISNVAFLCLQNDNPKAELYYRGLLTLNPFSIDGNINLASILSEKGQFEEADTLFERILLKYPNHFLVLFNYGSMHLMRGNYVDAENLLLQTIRVNSEFAPAYSTYAYLLEKLGRIEEADEQYGKAIKQKGCAIDIYVNYGAFKESIGELDDAEKLNQKILKIDPNNVAALNNLANIYVRKSKYAEAGPLFKKAMKISQQDISLLTNYGSYLDHENWDIEAADCYEKALKLNPIDMAALVNYANLLTKLKKFEEAEKHYKTAKENYPEHPQVLGSYAQMLAQWGKLSEANELYLKNIEFNSQNAKVLSNYAQFLQIFIKDSTRARDFYLNSIATDPKQISAHINLGVILEEQGKNLEAKEHYQTAVTLDSKDIIALFNLGVILDKLGEFNQSVIFYDKILDIDPKNIDTLNRYGNALFALKKYKDAEEKYLKALSIQPKFVLAMINYGIMLVKTGKLKLAEHNYKNAIDIEPDNANAHRNYADLLKQLERNEKAMDHYETARKLQPQDPANYVNYANLCLKLNLLKRAKELFIAVLFIDSDRTLAHYNLANMYFMEGDVELARKHYRKAIECNKGELNLDSLSVALDRI